MTSHHRRQSNDKKKPYRKPRTLSREKLEALAVICDPGKTNDVDCNLLPQMS